MKMRLLNNYSIYKRLESFRLVTGVRSYIYVPLNSWVINIFEKNVAYIFRK